MKLIESFISETFLYESVSEKDKHLDEMLANGWEYDGESFGEEKSVTYVKYNHDDLNMEQLNERLPISPERD